MARVRGEVDNTGMRPKFGDNMLTLPVTFDYSGGRADKNRTARTWSIVLGVFGIIVIVGTIFNRNRNLLLNSSIALALLLIISFIIRFPLQHEGKIRTEKIKLKDTDGILNYQSMWGIYDIEDNYPHYCRFRTGKSGLFILLNKDVILGKYDQAKFDHFEAISDAYNIAGSSKIQMCHLDFMDVVGSDNRLDESFANLSKVTNTDLKDLLTDIFTYQQEQMSKHVTSFDAYLFLWNGNDDIAWGTIQRILSCFMEANFRSYHVMTKTDIRELSKTIFLLKDFSAEDAMLQAFTTSQARGIIPIRVDRVDGTTEVLGKTVEEKRKEAELAEKKKELMRQEQRNKKKKNANDEEEIELF